MKKVILAGALLLLSVPAFAQGNNGGGNGGCGVGQQTNGCGGTTVPVTNNISPRQGQLQGQAQGQLQGQLQGQAQSSRNVNRNSVVGTNRNVNRNVSRSTSSSSSSATSRSYNAGNRQTMNYSEARHRLQAPGVAASFSSVQGSPCEGVPVGLGGSGPGFGALLQLPRESGNCWSERQAILLHSWGYSNAAIAVLSGNPVGVAVQNNPITYRTRAIRAKN